MPTQVFAGPNFKPHDFGLGSKIARHAELGNEQSLFDGLVFGFVSKRGYEIYPWGKFSSHGSNVAGDAMFDLASISKAFTVTAYHSLRDHHRSRHLDLDAKVKNILPQLSGDFTDELKMRHLLLFQAEYRKQVSAIAKSGKNVINVMLKDGLAVSPGHEWFYGDFSTILLGMVLEKITGQKLADILRNEIFTPLNMSETTFFPENLKSSSLSRFVPTEGGKRGVVHDEGAEIMLHHFGHAVGSAGLFAPTEDTLRFLAMFLDGGLTPSHRRILSKDTVGKLGGNWTPGIGGRHGFGYGFGRWIKFIDGYEYVVTSPGAFFKSGYTGCWLGCFPHEREKFGVFIGTNFLAKNGRIKKDQLFRWMAELVSDVILTFRKRHMKKSRQ